MLNLTTINMNRLAAISDMVDLDQTRAGVIEALIELEVMINEFDVVDNDFLAEFSDNSLVSALYRALF